LIEPPVPAEPLPVTAKWPLAPVLNKTMPLPAPVAEILRKVKLLAPIVVFWIFSAVPVVVVSVFTIVVLFCVAVTVPPPVAVNAAFAPVLRLIPPVKLMVEPVLVVRLIPVPEPLTAPLSETLPPFLLATLTERAALLPIVPE